VSGIFRHLRTRMIALLAALMVGILGLTVMAVSVVGNRFVRQQISADLQAAATVFERFFEDQQEQLVQSTQLLSGDFAFKQAYGSADHDTLYSAVRNLQQNRLSADLMILLDDEDLSVVADTRYQRSPPADFPFPELISEAETNGKPAWALEIIDGRLYQLITVPLLAPQPVAWIVAGFFIDDALASDLKELTGSDLTFVSEHSQPDITVPAIANQSAASQMVNSVNTDSVDFPASTLDQELRRSYSLAALAQAEGHHTTFYYESAGNRFAGLTIAIADRKTTVVLQRSLEAAMQPFVNLYKILAGIAIVGLLALIIGVAALARQITRPVQQLAKGARRVQQGDYSAEVEIQGRDEIAQLATSFNQMTRGLAAFQRYVPTQLVRTLIDKGIESVPQSRVATMLYTDIANFTNIAEQLEPRQLVALLNQYFSAVTIPINEYQGVITQYQGDAILAVFNLTGDDPEHASNALRAAIAIQEILNTHRFGDDKLSLVTRIGVNSGSVVAGSVGSAERMNYTVHGDSVNLAARLESLNKKFGTQVLTSQFTIDLADQSIPRTRIGSVPIDGKRAEVTVYKVA